MNIFISSQNIDEPHTTALIRELQTTGFQVDHSPRNPIYGYDYRWTNWYGKGLQDALVKTTVFIISIDFGWDSSTWMAIEADEALKLLAGRNIKQAFYFNPLHISIKAKGVLPYLKEQLPDRLDAVIETLNKLLNQYL